MPTPQCQTHLLAATVHVVGGLFERMSDRVAFVVAGAGFAVPWYRAWLDSVNNVFLALAPTLAGLFLLGKVVLVVWQIRNESRK